MTKKEEILRIFPKDIRRILEQIPADFNQIQELRLRTGRPVLAVCGLKEYFIKRDGTLADGILMDETLTGEIQADGTLTGGIRPEDCFVMTQSQMRETVEFMGSFSLYAAEEELRQGFMTLQGGHRVGVAGRIVAQGTDIRLMKFISFLNVRIAHEMKGCADPLMDYLYSPSGCFMSTLIISPPRWGKTTLLRDMIRQVSLGNPVRSRPGLTVGVVDERSEIGACYQGVPQNDLGPRTDVLDCCPKSQGMMMLVRSMAPAVVAVDEIGGPEEARAVEYAANCGCSLAASVHGASLEEIREKPCIGDLVKRKVFRRLVLLGHGRKPGQILGVWDGDGHAL